MTEQCPSCELEAGHPGPHHAHIHLPPDITTVFANMLNDLEAETQRLARWRRRERRSAMILLTLAGINLGAAIATIVVR